VPGSTGEQVAGIETTFNRYNLYLVHVSRDIRYLNVPKLIPFHYSTSSHRERYCISSDLGQEGIVRY